VNANRELWEKGDFARIVATAAGLDDVHFQQGDATGPLRTAARTAARRSRRPSCW
jgi:hypothetical protein